MDSEKPRPRPRCAHAAPTGALEGLRQRAGRGRRGRCSLVALDGQQHRSARSRTKLTRIPIRRHRQHRTRRQPHQLLAMTPTITGPAPSMPLVPITISPASYCRTTSRSICATAPWRISEWLWMPSRSRSPDNLSSTARASSVSPVKTWPGTVTTSAYSMGSMPWASTIRAP